MRKRLKSFKILPSLTCALKKHADQHTFAEAKKILSWNDVIKCRAGRRARACKADQKPEKDSPKLLLHRLEK